MNEVKNKLWVYSKPNQMINHEYTDDVAITWAANKEEALTKFKQYYLCNIEDIEEVVFNAHGVSILTDY